MIWLETSACNCNHPRQLLVFWKTRCRCFAGFFGPSCSVEILSVTGRTPGDASVTLVSSAPRLHLSSRCLQCPADVTWPTAENSSLCCFQTVLCVLPQVLKDRSPLLSWFCLAFTPASKQPALSNKMSPHKMNRSRRLRGYRTSYQKLRVEQGSQKTYCLQTLCITLGLPPSVDCICDRSKHSKLNSKM